MTRVQLAERVLGFKPRFKGYQIQMVQNQNQGQYGKALGSSDHTFVVSILTDGYGGRGESEPRTKILVSLLVWAPDGQLLFAGIPSQHLTFSYGGIEPWSWGLPTWADNTTFL